LQAKLLRVLQERKITRLGGESPVSVDIRVVAATNKDLRQAIDAREFREDLYFRISTFRLRIQPLRERPLDIMPLVMQSLARHGDSGLPYSVTAEAQQMLQAYPWPGNVRELENVVQRAVVLCTGQTITPAHLLFDEMSALTPAENTSAPAPTGAREFVSVVPSVQPMSAELSPTREQPPPVVAQDASTLEQSSTFSVAALPPQAIDMEPSTVNLQDVIKSSEHAVIMSAIQNTESREEAARLLGISPRTLRYKLAQLRERGLMLNAA